MKFEVIYQLCIAVSCLFEIYLVRDFYSAFHKYRSVFLNPYIRFSVFVLLVCVNIGINFQNNSSLNLFVVPSLYLLLIVILFRGSIKLSAALDRSNADHVCIRIYLSGFADDSDECPDRSAV